MFKRTSKLTALLVAAAAIVSVVPANAAERLGTQEGTITNIVSFDGKHFYDGYKDDDQDNSLYFNDGEKDTEIEDADDYSVESIVKYGKNYIVINDGDDEYLLDLTTGKVNDEDLEDKKSNVKTSLRSKLKKTDRYGSQVTVDVEKIFNNTYGDVWYQYTAGDKVGFTDEKGKYIDAARIANVYVYTDSKGKNVKFEEFGDVNNGLKVDLLELKPVAQDEDFIYAVAKVSVEPQGDTEQESSEQYFLQKISKEQGEKKDDAYVPKSVASYYLESNFDGDVKFDCEDSSIAYKILVDESYDGYAFDPANVVIKKDIVYAAGVKDDSVKVFKIKLKKDKVDRKLANGTTKANVDTYIAEKDDDCDHDIVNGAVSVDINGDIWALDKGKVVKFSTADFKFEDVYTCDRSLNELEVYDEKNLAVWNTEGEIYTTVQEGAKAVDEENKEDKEENTDENKEENTDENKEENKEENKTDKAGWDKNADGTWSYYKDGAAVKGQWVQDGNWYYLKADGIMATGWLQDAGNWYYLNASGAMATGWIQDTNGKWYYLNASGAMLANTTVDGYVLGADGAWVK